MLGEAIDEGAEASGVAEVRGPLLVGEVGGDDGGAALVASVFPSTLADGGSRRLIDAVVPCRTATTTMAIAT